MANIYRPHLIVLPEDAAYASLMNGFLLHRNVDPSQVTVKRPCRGYGKLLEKYEQEYKPKLAANPQLRVLLLLDADHDLKARQALLESKIVSGTCYLLCEEEAEDFKRAAGGGHLEKLGELLAEECYEKDSGKHWASAPLLNNLHRLSRIFEALRPILMPSWDKN